MIFASPARPQCASVGRGSLRTGGTEIRASVCPGAGFLSLAHAREYGVKTRKEFPSLVSTSSRSCIATSLCAWTFTPRRAAIVVISISVARPAGSGSRLKWIASAPDSRTSCSSTPAARPLRMMSLPPLASRFRCNDVRQPHRNSCLAAPHQACSPFHSLRI